MVILLSVITALGFGAGDYAGGRAARRTSVLHVLLGAHAVGLLGVAIATPFMGAEFTTRDVVFGAVGGFVGLIAIGLMYRRLAVGPMVVVAPITAVTSAAVPALWGLARGEVLSFLAGSGVVIALLAIVLVSQGGEVDGTEESHAEVTAAVIGESLLAGACFGVFFIFLDETNADSAPWPLVSGRFTTVVVLVLVIAFLRNSSVRGSAGGLSPVASTAAPASTALADTGMPWMLIFLTGFFDGGANLMFLLATGLGNLSTVAVLSSLYPVVTVALARGLDGESMKAVQVAGLFLALLATALITLG